MAGSCKPILTPLNMDSSRTYYTNAPPYDRGLREVLQKTTRKGTACMLGDAMRTKLCVYV